jgi:phosphate transport system substrate-binding protein
MKSEIKYFLLTVVFLTVILVGCEDERKETPTKGRVTVVTAESVAPLIKEEKAKFEELYPQAHVELLEATTREAVARFFNDSIKVIVTSRPFNSEERAVAKKANMEFGEYKIAIDGIAIIVHPSNPITQLRTTQLDSILNGTITTWKEFGSKRFDGNIQLCLPSRNSGTYEVVSQKILHGKNFAVPAMVGASTSEVIQFVSQHQYAIGMTGLNWLPDSQKKVGVLELADPNAPDSLGTRGQYFKPCQAYVYQQYYPLTRDVYVYSRTDPYSVGNGFLAFIRDAPGQKIVLNSGLVPATMPVRLVQLTNKGQ